MSDINNPFTNAELKEIFENQKNKIPFEIKKSVKDEQGELWDLKLSGRFIPDSLFDIWNDDYIVDFDKMTSMSGACHACNRFENFDKLKQEIFNAFDLVESQLTFF